MLDLPKTLRVRQQKYGHEGWTYTDEYLEVGADYFRMAPDRFQQALDAIWEDAQTVSIPAGAKMIMVPKGRPEHETAPDWMRPVEARRWAAAKERRERIRRWILECCVLNHYVEGEYQAMVEACQAWHAEHGHDVPHEQLFRRVIHESARGTRRRQFTVPGRYADGKKKKTTRTILLGVALKDD